jgi:hypothetical protein
MNTKGCRICEVAKATGEDGLCDGCRTALTLARVTKPVGGAVAPKEARDG